MKFTSKYKEHRLVIVPTYKQIVGMTQQLVTGKSIQFMNNEFSTEKQEEIDFLRAHAEFGINIHEVPSQESIDEEMVKRAEEIIAKKKAKQETIKIETAVGEVEITKEALELGAELSEEEKAEIAKTAVPIEEVVAETFACPVEGCGFVAKSKLGLGSHMRSHK